MGVSLALPSLESLQAATAPKSSARRFVCVSPNYGMNPGGFFPEQTGSDYVMPTLLKPLERHKRDLTVFSNLDHPEVGGGHGCSNTLLNGVELKDAKENPGQIIVNLAVNPINNAVGISVNEIDYPTPGDLIPVLQNHIEKNPMVRVLIRADKEVRYATMKSLLEAVGKAGIANVTFSVVDKEAAPTPS